MTLLFEGSQAGAVPCFLEEVQPILFYLCLQLIKRGPPKSALLGLLI